MSRQSGSNAPDVPADDGKDLKERERSIRSELKEIKREQIVAAALDLFYRKGYHKTKIDDIAAALSVGKPHIYNYFRSKVELLEVVASRGTDEVLRAVESASHDRSDPETTLRRVAYAFTQSALVNHKHAIIYFREYNSLPADTRSDLREKRIKIDKTIQSIIEWGMESGHFESNVPYISSLSITGMMSYTFAWYRSKNTTPIDTICTEISDNVIRMVKVGSLSLENNNV